MVSNVLKSNLGVNNADGESQDVWGPVCWQGGPMMYLHLLQCASEPTKTGESISDGGEGVFQALRTNKAV